MKYVKYFLVAAVLTIILSSFSISRTSRLSESIYPGNPFPSIDNIENNQGTTLSLSDLKGQKVLVVFWAAYDAESRKENVLLSNMIKKHNYPVKLVSLSFDKNESVYERTISLDELDQDGQFLVKDDYGKLFERYQLNNGFKSYLIDEAGKTIAIDVKSNDLNKLLSMN